MQEIPVMICQDDVVAIEAVSWAVICGSQSRKIKSQKMLA